MRTLPYHDDWGDEQVDHGSGVCEWCGSPVNRHGESVLEHEPRHDVLTLDAVRRTIQRLWDHREMCEVLYYRIILGKTTDVIAYKLGKSKQAINHLLIAGVKKWPELERLLFERNNETKNKKVKRKVKA